MQQGHILELVYDFLVVLDTLKHVFGHKLREDLFSTLDLNINYAVIVVDFARSHFPRVDHDHEEEAIDDDKGAVRDIRLHIDCNLLNMVVVLE